MIFEITRTTVETFTVEANSEEQAREFACDSSKQLNWERTVSTAVQAPTPTPTPTHTTNATQTTPPLTLVEPPDPPASEETPFEDCQCSECLLGYDL